MVTVYVMQLHNGLIFEIVASDAFEAYEILCNQLHAFCLDVTHIRNYTK